MTDHTKPDPTEQELFEKVAAALGEAKGIDPAEITLDSKFEQLGVDSLDAMELLFELEEQLDVDIPDAAARQMRTVRDVVVGLGKLIRGEPIELPESPGEPPAAAQA
ncbi:MAG: acyl carrier protein [Planctomycetes bacterium]|nr:acyl carrier protein [Planctomycetota bacterium]MCB9872115.1 acyl carrier protein [Planctomycetota bacterium]